MGWYKFIISAILIIFIFAHAAKAQKTAIDSLVATLKNQPDTTKIKTLIGIADRYASNNDDEKALSNYLEALRLAETIRDKPALFSSLYNLAKFYEKLDKPVQALEFALRAQKIAEAKGNKQNLYDVLDLIGQSIYFNDGQYEEGLVYAQRMSKIADEIGDKQQIIRLKMSFGDLYMALQKYHDAVNADSTALIMAKQIHDKKLIISCMHDIGLGFELQKQYNKALRYYLDVYTLALTGKAQLGFYAEEVSKIYLFLKKYNEALVYAKKSLQDARQEGDTHIELEIYYTLREIYLGEGDYKQAYDYFSKYTTLENSLNSAALQNKMSLLQAAYDNQKQTRAIEFVQKQTALQKKLKNVLIGASVLLLAVIFLIANKYRLEKIAEAALSSKNAELNHTISQLKSAQTQLIHAEKMASLGELTAGIAHEIQNPLNFVNNFSEVSRELLSEMKNELAAGHMDDAAEIAADLDQSLEKINHHGKRADSIVKGMLEHSRAGSGAREPTNLNNLADEYLRLAYHGLRAKDKSFDVELLTDFDELLPLATVIPQDIGRVLLNLFNNAFYAVREKAKTAGDNYKAAVKVCTSVANEYIFISVKDNGAGIPDAIKEKIMHPFFTTKPTGEGTGLGLSLSYDIIVKGHRGNIQVNSKEGEGAEFVVSLPAI